VTVRSVRRAVAITKWLGDGSVIVGTPASAIQWPEFPIRRVSLRRPCLQSPHDVLDRMNCRRLPTFILDSGPLADRCIAPTVPEFDYPRSDLPSHVRYVGAVHPSPSVGFRLLPWWGELNGDRPVVHVTQGTIDNADLAGWPSRGLPDLGPVEILLIRRRGFHRPAARLRGDGKNVAGLRVSGPQAS
jgi:hypothetical protein